MRNFLDEAQALFEYTRDLRRDFHKHPEIGLKGDPYCQYCRQRVIQPGDGSEDRGWADRGSWACWKERHLVR